MCLVMRLHRHCKVRLRANDNAFVANAGTSLTSTTEKRYNMTDTSELLESIGRDASLRHASGETLSQALTGMRASEGLQRAAMSGDSDHLKQELGHKANEAIQVNQNPHHGGCSGGDEERESDDATPQRDGEKKTEERSRES